MEQEEKERLERGTQEELNRQCGDGTVQKVEVLQHGDEPVIEPGQAIIRVILTPTGEDDPEETLHAFEKAHRAAIEDLRKKIAQKMPFIGRVEFTLPAQPGERKHPVVSMSIGPLDRTAIGRNLTPVMARLDPRDVEVLDALITAGIVSNRAERRPLGTDPHPRAPRLHPAPRAHRQDRRAESSTLREFRPVYPGLNRARLNNPRDCRTSSEADVWHIKWS